MIRDDALVPFDDDTPSAVRRFFFRDAALTEAPETISWWEKRRLAYNLAVGAAGLTTLTAGNLLQVIGPNGHPGLPPLGVIAAYAVLANVMYTGGWISELLLRPLFGRKTPVVGATIFRYGFVLSVALTLLPIGAFCIDLLVRLAKWTIGGSG